MRPGQVRAVRQLSNRVQAEVCLGATVKDGYAVIRVETQSPEVMAALDSLHKALAADAQRFVSQVVNAEQAFR